MNETSQDNSVWESIPVGDDLGVMDYVMTEKMIADYREVVGNPTAAYPTVAARHPANLFYRKYRSVMPYLVAGEAPAAAGAGAAPAEPALWLPKIPEAIQPDTPATTARENHQGDMRMGTILD